MMEEGLKGVDLMWEGEEEPIKNWWEVRPGAVRGAIKDGFHVPRGGLRVGILVGARLIPKTSLCHFMNILNLIKYGILFQWSGR